MSGLAITAYLRRLCQDLDEGRPLEPFPWRRALVPLAVPAVMGIAAGLGGCVRDEDCTDGIDNDRDGMVDCADDDCEDHVGCRAAPEYAAPMPEEDRPAPPVEPPAEATPATPDGGAPDAASPDAASPDAAAEADAARPAHGPLKLPARSTKLLRSKAIPRIRHVETRVLYAAPFE